MPLILMVTLMLLLSISLNPPESSLKYFINPPLSKKVNERFFPLSDHPENDKLLVTYADYKCEFCHNVYLQAPFIF
jgi:hypothetical protein